MKIRPPGPRRRKGRRRIVACDRLCRNRHRAGLGEIVKTGVRKSSCPPPPQVDRTGIPQGHPEARIILSTSRHYDQVKTARIYHGGVRLYRTLHVDTRGQTQVGNSTTIMKSKYAPSIHLSVAICAVLTAVPAMCKAEPTAPERKPLSQKNWESKLRDGDMVFIRSFSGNADDIAALSGQNAPTEADKRFTHCGIVFKDKNGAWTVYEGKGRYKQDPVNLKQWQTDEANGNPLQEVYVRGLADRSLLTKDVLSKMKDRAGALHHTHYDSGFMWSDDFIYCSELIWKAYFTALGKNVFKEPHAIRDYLDGLPADRVKAIITKLNLTKARDCRPEGKKDFSDGERAIIPEEIYESAVLVSVTDDSPLRP
jgi:Permuted papain-like amidase enzyme, YaeF/YiiX, C92 family